MWAPTYEGTREVCVFVCGLPQIQLGTDNAPLPPRPSSFSFFFLFSFLLHFTLTLELKLGSNCCFS
jgi:hypothetical protein